VAIDDAPALTDTVAIDEELGLTVAVAMGVAVMDAVVVDDGSKLTVTVGVKDLLKETVTVRVSVADGVCDDDPPSGILGFSDGVGLTVGDGEEEGGVEDENSKDVVASNVSGHGRKTMPVTAV
jgi:hypothetical protein